MDEHRQRDDFHAPDGTVLVTGATGFVGSAIVAELLAHGWSVRGTTRDPGSRTSDLLRELPGAGERLELVAADLLDDASLRGAVHGCRHVLHTASPYALDVEDAERDLVRPAEQGTLAMLRAAAEEGGIGRVVVTSSVAAITDEPDGRVLTEDDWNERSSLDRNPYYYSKVRAERAAWRYVEEHDPDFRLVVLNPILVTGPSIVPSLNQSNAAIAELLTGGFPAIVDLSWGLVDVRDVAAAHRLALTSPDAGGRNILGSDVVTIREATRILREHGWDDYRLPRVGLDNAVGRPVAWLASFLQPSGSGTYLRTHLGRRMAYDASKAERELGVRFRPSRETLLDTAGDLVRWGHVPDRRLEP